MPPLLTLTSIGEATSFHVAISIPIMNHTMIMLQEICMTGIDSEGRDKDELQKLFDLSKKIENIIMPALQERGLAKPKTP